MMKRICLDNRSFGNCNNKKQEYRVRRLSLEDLETRALLSATQFTVPAESTDEVATAIIEPLSSFSNSASSQSASNNQLEVDFSTQDTLNAENYIQKVYSKIESTRIESGGAISIPVMYQDIGGTGETTGMGLKIHYDSRKLTFNSTDDLFTKGILGAVQDNDDTGNEDGDSSTDRVITVAWMDLAGMWPGNAEQLLMNLNFTVNANASGTTTINYTGSEAVDYTFEGESTTLNIQPAVYSGITVQESSGNDFSATKPVATEFQLHEWSTFNVELWTQSVPLIDGSWTVDITYDRSLFKPVRENSIGCQDSEILKWEDTPIEDSNNSVLSVTIAAPNGWTLEESWGRIGSIQLVPATQSETIKNVGVSLDDSPRELRIQVEEELLTNQVIAVPYDLSDNGKVDSDDFILFAQSYGCGLNQDGSYNLCDFDHSGKVDSNDFIDFATNYGISSTKGTVIFPQMKDKQLSEGNTAAMTLQSLESTSVTDFSITELEEESTQTILSKEFISNSILSEGDSRYTVEAIAVPDQLSSNASRKISNHIEQDNYSQEEVPEEPLQSLPENRLMESTVKSNVNSDIFDSIFEDWDEFTQQDEEETIDTIVEPMITNDCLGQ